MNYLATVPKLRTLPSARIGGAVRYERSVHGMLLSVLLAGLYLRLVLAPSRGFAPDTSWMIKYVAYAEKSGPTGVTDIWGGVGSAKHENRPANH